MDSQHKEKRKRKKKEKKEEKSSLLPIGFRSPTMIGVPRHIKYLFYPKSIKRQNPISTLY